MSGHILRNILKKMNSYAQQLLNLNLSLVLTTATGQKQSNIPHLSLAKFTFVALQYSFCFRISE